MLIRATVELKMPSRRSRSRANKNLAEAQKAVSKQLERLDELFSKGLIPSGYVSDGEGQRLSEEFHAAVLPSVPLKPTYAKIVSGAPKQSAVPTTRSSMIGKKKLWGDESDDESDYEPTRISTVRKEVAEVREVVVDVVEDLAEVREAVEDICGIIGNVTNASQTTHDDSMLADFGNLAKLLALTSVDAPPENLQVGSVVYGMTFRTPPGGSSIFHAAALALFHKRQEFYMGESNIDALQAEYDRLDPAARDYIAMGLRSETLSHCKTLVVNAQDMVPLFCNQDGLNRFFAIRDALLGIADNHFWSPDSEIPWELVIGLCYATQSLITVVGPELDDGYEVTTNFMPRILNPNHIVLRWDGANYSPLLKWHSA